MQSRLRESAPTVHTQLHAETEALPKGEAGAEVLDWPPARRASCSSEPAPMERAQLLDSQWVNLPGEPDAGNLHVRFEEGGQGIALVPTLP